MRGRKALSCYAIQEAADSWEAICTDLDIAVQGKSYNEVSVKFGEAIYPISLMLTRLQKRSARGFSRGVPLGMSDLCSL